MKRIILASLRLEVMYTNENGGEFLGQRTPIVIRVTRGCSLSTPPSRWLRWRFCDHTCAYFWRRWCHHTFQKRCMKVICIFTRKWNRYNLLISYLPLVKHWWVRNDKRRFRLHRFVYWFFSTAMSPRLLSLFFDNDCPSPYIYYSPA